MKVTPIFDPEKEGRPMRVAAFMSGSGTNILRLLEWERQLKEKEGVSPFDVVFIFSDRSDGVSQGERIARERGIPYFSYDIRAFYRLKGLKRTSRKPEGLSTRREYDLVAKRLIEAFQIDLVALGGYMSYTTLDRCVNVHPADLSILGPDGKRRYVGDHAVMDAIASGETVLHSSTIWTDEGVDTGPLLMVSGPVRVELPEPLESLLRDHDRWVRVAEMHQHALKEAGDWIIFPKTIDMIARGRFALDEFRQVYVDGKRVPEGFREEGG